MHIKISNAAEFQGLLEALAGELVEANIHFKLHRALVDSIPEYVKEYNQTATFWSLTHQAHLDVALFRLCKIFDQHSKSLNLRNLLDTIKQNLSLFEIENFRERLKDSPFVESLSEGSRKPDIKQLEKDLAFVSEKNPLVEILVNKWRNNLFAHIGPKYVIKKRRISAEYPLTVDDIEKLLKTGMSILNRYSSLFRANTYSTQIIGHDDFKFVLKSIRENLNLMDRQLEEERKKWTKSQT